MQKNIYYKKSKIYETTNNPIQNALKAFEMDTAPFSYKMRKAIETTFFKKKQKEQKQMWIAKNRCTGEEYGTEYESIMDCYDYINKDLKVLNKFYKLVEQEKDELFKTGYNGANVIQCYNTIQKRYADGFDF